MATTVKDMTSAEIQAAMTDEQVKEIVDYERSQRNTTTTDGGCVLSGKASNQKGYVQATVPTATMATLLKRAPSKQYKVSLHMLACRLSNGPPPAVNAEAHHRCHHPNCFNAEKPPNNHLVWLLPEEHQQVKCPPNVVFICEHCGRWENYCRAMQKANQGHPGPHCI